MPTLIFEYKPSKLTKFLCFAFSTIILLERMRPDLMPIMIQFFTFRFYKTTHLQVLKEILQVLNYSFVINIILQCGITDVKVDDLGNDNFIIDLVSCVCNDVLLHCKWEIGGIHVHSDRWMKSEGLQNWLFTSIKSKALVINHHCPDTQITSATLLPHHLLR